MNTYDIYEVSRPIAALDAGYDPRGNPLKAVLFSNGTVVRHQFESMQTALDRAGYNGPVGPDNIGLPIVRVTKSYLHSAPEYDPAYDED